jgi:PKHD-type hydroxylase
MLTTIHNVLNPEQLLHMREQLHQAQWSDGKQTAGSQAAAIKSNLQLDDRSSIAQALSNTILSTLFSHPQFIAAALPLKVLPPKFNCYQQGGHYGKHIDNAIMTLADNGDVLRTDLSATLFLSDCNDYDGGELTIETDYGAQSIKLAAGDMILYPSSSLHQVTAVTRGRRLCAIFWLQSMVRQAGQRALLYDLDRSIQTLTIERGNTDTEVSRLTGIYHNLLRQWAES